MTTSVFHGLPSCLEPGLIEPQVLRLKLTSPSSNSPQSPNHPLLYSLPQQHINTPTKHNETITSNVLYNTGSKSDENGAWASLLSLTNTNEPAPPTYIHPLEKRSESVLTDKSLEMCTESLGSETGSDTNDDFPSLPEILHSRETSGRSRERVEVTRRKCCAGGGARLPPPLPSISSSGGGFRVRPHREGGRLVMWAVSVASPQACFKAEREDGRLRLCFAEDISR